MLEVLVEDYKVKIKWTLYGHKTTETIKFLYNIHNMETRKCNIKVYGSIALLEMLHSRLISDPLWNYHPELSLLCEHPYSTETNLPRVFDGVCFCVLI